jgi:CDGSH-type Zn-finger protein/uncharacterized Fe-S cluster protein YjdI
MTQSVKIPTREQLLYWLHEASEIEHHLMCCYLYAAFSLKRVEPRWSTEQSQAVQRWRESIMSVVFEEMTHLALVGNLTNSLGGTFNASRPPFPVDAGPYPAGFVIRLQPFSAATIEHFKFLERPSNEALADSEAFAPQTEYRRAVPEGRLSPGPRDYATVGELYDVLAQSLDACAVAMSEKGLFVGDPALQVDGGLASLPGIVAVVDLQSAKQAISTIVTQGEGASDARADSHFRRFSQIGDELASMMAADPSFEPAWPAATNPVMNAPVHSHSERVHISEPRIARWLDIGNAMYTTSLRCLLQGFGSVDRSTKATWLSASFALMRALVPVGQGLASRPATNDPDGVHAGLTFTPLRTLARLPQTGAATFVAERLAQLRARAVELPLELVAGESAATWQDVIDLLATQRVALLEMGEPAPAMAPVAASTPQAPDASFERTPAATGPVPANQESGVEVVRGSNITIVFDSRRCIHSRHCVLDAPSVFLANTPGQWIRPNEVSAEYLVAVALSCPSGAIRYERRDGVLGETAPAVNQLRVRENGPYAIHAALKISGHDDGFRATLCRCGLSRNKPWCDSSHVEGGFAATGEPKSGVVDPLPSRDGDLHVTPTKNGPLDVRGSLEICSGTGRTIARVNGATLCRCGHSGNKPFCDGSHRAAHFVAEGA